MESKNQIDYYALKAHKRPTWAFSSEHKVLKAPGGNPEGASKPLTRCRERFNSLTS